MKAVRILVPVIFCLVCGFSGCTKSPTSSSYQNKLNIGTGSSGFAIVGETAVFSGILPVTITWRLESSADMAGSSVIIVLEKQVSGSFVSDTAETFSNAQSYGHIMLSSINVNSTGHFRMTGKLQTPPTTIASKEFDIN